VKLTDLGGGGKIITFYFQTLTACDITRFIMAKAARLVQPKRTMVRKTHVVRMTPREWKLIKRGAELAGTNFNAFVKHYSVAAAVDIEAKIGRKREMPVDVKVTSVPVIGMTSGSDVA
jgi:hypothetical protein